MRTSVPMALLAILALLVILATRRSPSKTYEDEYHKTFDGQQSSIAFRCDYSDANAPSVGEYQTRLDEVNTLFGSLQPFDVNVFTNLSEYQACLDVEFKAFVCPQTIIAEFDHRTIGGSRLAHLANCTSISGCPPQDQINASRWWHVFAAIRLWWNYPHTIRSSLPYIEHPEELRRFQRTDVTHSTKDIQSLKSPVLLSVMRDLHTCLSLDRPLVCAISVAFNPTANVSNNVGIIWLTYTPGETPASLQDQLTKNAYQASGSNYALIHNLGGSKSSEVRQSIDAVISSMFSEDVSPVQRGWTYRVPQEYAVYIALSVVKVGKSVYSTQTLTVATPAYTAARDTIELGLGYFTGDPQISLQSANGGL